MRHFFRDTTFAALLLFVGFAAHAKTASEVYEQAAKSTVVVLNNDDKGKTHSMGSGVVLPDGSVATNCHVVKGGSQFKVRIGAKEYPAALQYSDWERDVCTLDVSGLRAPAIIIGSTKKLKVGARVYAIGAPKGFELTLSDGIVSSLREAGGGRYIQTTAAISPGSSGGGLFDTNGTLIGLTTFHIKEGQNLNFAVPVEWIKDISKRSTKESVTAQPLTEWLSKYNELEDRKDWPALLKYSHRWTEAQPSSDLAWLSLGNALFYVTDTYEATEAYLRALQINPDYAEAWNNLGIAYKDLNKTEKSIKAYQQALQINPDYAEAWYNLGNTYGKDGYSGPLSQDNNTSSLRG